MNETSEGAPVSIIHLPDPPEITEADLRRMREEAKAWGKSFSEKIRLMENITPDDWRATAKADR